MPEPTYDELAAEFGKLLDEREEWRRIIREQGAEIERVTRERDEAKNLIADMVIKATEFGTQDGDFVANYILPTGPLHRAMPWLEQRGIVVRPGFDGRVHSAPALSPADVPAQPEPVHVYTSTACQHGLHGRCRLVCKFCEVACGCSCGHPAQPITSEE